MNILVNILKVIHVVSAVSDGRKFDFQLIEVKIGRAGIKIEKYLKDIKLEDISGRKLNTPLVLTISGKGVISKDYKENSAELKQLTEQPNDFLFASENIGGGVLRVAFLRRKLYDVLCNELDIEKMPLVEVRIDANNNPEQEARKAAEEFWLSEFGIKEAFTPSMRSSNLLSLVAKKALLPLLLILLVLFLINFFVQQELSDRLKEQHSFLVQTKRNTAQVEKSLGEKQQILDHLANEAKYSYALIADRIASVVPDGITLTELNIQPLRDKVQENKTINIERNKVLIRGKSSNPALVTIFTDSLQVLSVLGSVQLIMQNRDRDDNYQFALNVSL